MKIFSRQTHKFLLCLWAGFATVLVADSPHQPNKVAEPSITLTSPKDGSTWQFGRIEISWVVSPDFIRLADDQGLRVRVSLDDAGMSDRQAVLADVSASTGPRSMHMLGCEEGAHIITTRLITESGSVLSASSVRYISAWKGEVIPELALVRATPLGQRVSLQDLDDEAVNEEGEGEKLRNDLLSRCGGHRPLINPDATCRWSAEQPVNYSVLCRNLVGRCVNTSGGDWDEERLVAAWERLQGLRRGVRRRALGSVPMPRQEARATIIWQGNQYMNLEADFIEELLGGTYRAAVNDSDMTTFAPNALVVLQETFPVDGKESFWSPASAYINSFVEKGWGKAAVFLTSDEKLLAPLEWVKMTKLTMRSTWHPELHGEENVIAVPFGYKSGFHKPSIRFSRNIRGASTAQSVSSCGLADREHNGQNTSPSAAAVLHTGQRLWNFVGNANGSSSRMYLIDQVMERGGAEALGGYMLLTHSFDDLVHGLGVASYRSVLEQSKFTLAPEGVHVDTYRMVEAIEAGSIPIVSCDEYFQALFGQGHPIPCVNHWSWEEVKTTMEAVDMQNGYACKVQTWWEDWKLHISAQAALFLFSQ